MRNSPWLVGTYALIIFFGLLVALPNVLPQSALDRVPSWLPHQRVSLGLDLRGGSHLVLEVDHQDPDAKLKVRLAFEFGRGRFVSAVLPIVDFLSEVGPDRLLGVRLDGVDDWLARPMEMAGLPSLDADFARIPAQAPARGRRG